MSEPILLLKNYLKSCYENFVSVEDGEDGQRPLPFIREDEQNAFQRKRTELNHRQAIILKNIVHGQVIREQGFSTRVVMEYMLLIEHLISHQSKTYLEEQLQVRKAVVDDGELIDDYLVSSEGFFPNQDGEMEIYLSNQEHRSKSDLWRFVYNRLEAVKYAERWWDDYNPNYRTFDNNCTNYISQCMRAGDAPMRGAPNRSEGWWYQRQGEGDQWSFSWSVAHSLRWYLSGSNKGLRASEVSSARDLMMGDIICYDFNGDGRWQHTTIVVDKDNDGMPLVNANSTNSRMRYWTYEDSSAWTPNIQYKFFHINDEMS